MENNQRHKKHKYKDIAKYRRNRVNVSEEYKLVKPEKVYFDILPQAPIVTDTDEVNSKLVASNIKFEELAMPASVEQETDSKQILNKHPKKYHRRQRRNAVETPTRHKRNPFLRYESAQNVLDNQHQQQPLEQQQFYLKYVLKSNTSKIIEVIFSV